MWAILGNRAGDNNSVIALAEALNIPFSVKKMEYNDKSTLNSILFRKTLSGIDNFEEIIAPFPEIVISSGIKNEPIVRYIKKISPKTKIIYIGRTWANIDNFDIIVSTPQYRLSGDNVKVFPLPPIPISKIQENNKIQPVLYPNIFVSIGGNAGPYVVNEESIYKMMHDITEYALSKNATLYVTTSARTPREVIPIIENSLTIYDYFYEWKSNNVYNPYWDWMAKSDEMIVTSDSVSMMADMIAYNKPTYIYDINPINNGERYGYIRSWLYTQLIKLGPRRLSRDVDLVINSLISKNLVSLFGKNYVPLKNNFIKENISEIVTYIKSNV